MYRHLLVPIDGSELSVDTAAKATAFAKTMAARVTFLHARPDSGAPDDASAAQAIIAQAVSAGRAIGVACLSEITVNSRPYQAILDAAQEHGCDLIFMASHGQRGARGLELGPQTQAVLAHAVKGTRIPVTLWSGPRILVIKSAFPQFQPKPTGAMAPLPPTTLVAMDVFDPKTGKIDPKYSSGFYTVIDGVAVTIK